MQRQKKINSKKMLLLIGATLIAGFMVLVGPPWQPLPFPTGKKLPGQPPVGNPLATTTVYYSGFIG